MSAETLKPIKTPFSRLLQLWRRRYLPVLVWGGSVALALFLMGGQRVYVDAQGVVESSIAYITPLEEGQLERLAVDLLDTVSAGQVVAVMDDSVVMAELAVAEAELERVRTLLDAEMAAFEQEQHMEQASVQSDMRRFQLNEEQARLDHLDRVIGHETDMVTLERLDVQLKREEALVKQNLLDKATYDQTRLEHAALKTRIDKDRRAIALAEANIATASERREVQESLPTSSQADALLRSLQADIAAQQALVSEVQERRKTLTLVAPFEGQVVAITRRPGEMVPRGDPILTITGGGGNRVLAYVDERYAKRFSVGDQVELHSKSSPVVVVIGEVLKVGTTVDVYPLRLLTSPMMPQYGYPVLVGGLPDDVYRPGEALNLRLRAMQP